MPKKVLVIGTSPRRNGNSIRLANAFAEGARQVGNEVEIISLAGKNIGFCLGCWACARTGQCAVHDDANEIVEKIRDADVIAFATPIFYYEMSGQMKVLLDRTNALYSSDYRFRDVYLLTTAQSAAPDAPKYAEGGLRGWLKVFNKAQLKGHIFAGGVFEAGEIEGHPELEQARKMGARV